VRVLLQLQLQLPSTTDEEHVEVQVECGGWWYVRRSGVVEWGGEGKECKMHAKKKERKAKCMQVSKQGRRRRRQPLSDTPDECHRHPVNGRPITQRISRIPARPTQTLLARRVYTPLPSPTPTRGRERFTPSPTQHNPAPPPARVTQATPQSTSHSSAAPSPAGVSASSPSPQRARRSHPSAAAERPKWRHAREDAVIARWRRPSTVWRIPGARR